MVKTNDNEVISILKKAREKEHMSESEALVLLILFKLKNGAESGELKKELVFLNGNDIDEAEEALDSLRAEGYIGFDGKRWNITEAGREMLKKIAVFSIVGNLKKIDAMQETITYKIPEVKGDKRSRKVKP